MFVLDASVIVKWFIHESDSDIAKKFIDTHVSGKGLISAPDLLSYEVSNVLLLKAHLLPIKVVDCIEALYDLRITLISPSQENIREVILTADCYRLTVYDAAYVVLAKRLGYSLITADVSLYEKTRSHFNVKLLSVFSSLLLSSSR